MLQCLLTVAVLVPVVVSVAVGVAVDDGVDPIACRRAAAVGVTAC